MIDDIKYLYFSTECKQASNISKFYPHSTQIVSNTK